MSTTVFRLLNSGFFVVSLFCLSTLDNSVTLAKEKTNNTNSTPEPASAVKTDKDKVNQDKKPESSKAPTPKVTCGDAFGLVTAGAINYTNCLDPLQGNDVGAGNPLLTMLNDNDIFGDFNWVLGGKSDEANGGEFGLSFKGSDSGFWSVAKEITTPFVLSLKSSTFFSAYFFDGITSTSGGSWNTIGVDLAGNGQFGKELSHATLFVVDKSSTIDVGITDVGTTDGGSVSVPEPSTLAGLALLVGGLTVSRRRKFS